MNQFTRGKHGTFKYNVLNIIHEFDGSSAISEAVTKGTVLQTVFLTQHCKC